MSHENTASDIPEQLVLPEAPPEAPNPIEQPLDPQQLLQAHRTRRYVPNPSVQFYKSEERLYTFIYDIYFNAYKAPDGYG
jgi:hypothetical protein